MNPYRMLTAALAIALAAPAPGFAQETAERLFQEGLYQEETQGDLRSAIGIFEHILDQFPDNRSVAANALMHIGLCQEKLGSAEAQRAYDRLLREYGDQAEVAAQARARLADLRGLARAARRNEPTGPVARMLMKVDRGCQISGARPSPDGTRVAYSNECDDGAVYVRDLRSGEIRRVTEQGYHMGAVWSPDGTRLAVTDLNAEVNGSRYPARIIDLESGAVEMPAGLEEMWFIHDWSPDGEWLAGELAGDEVILSLRTGEVVTLVSEVERGWTRADFSPDSRYVAYSDDTNGLPDIWVMALGTRERRRVTTERTAEDAPQWSPDGGTLVYRGESGLWAIPVANGAPDGQPRLVRTGGGPLADWTENGAYYYRTNRLARAYRIPLDPATAQATGPPERMPQLDGLEWFAWSPDMRQIAVSDWGDWTRMLLIRGRSVTEMPFGDDYQVATLWWTHDGSEVLFTYRDWGQSDTRKTVMGINPVDGTMRELFPRRDSIFHIHVSPDGTRMVFFRGPGPFRAANELVVSDLGAPEAGQVLASELDPEGQFSFHYGQPAFSPDGSQILFVRQDRSVGSTGPVGLYVTPSDGSGPPRLVATLPLIARATWDPSGRFIAFQEMDTVARTSTVAVVSVETGVKRRVLLPSPMSETLRLRTWSPDGRWIAYSLTTGGSEFWVTDDLLGESRRGP